MSRKKTKRVTKRSGGGRTPKVAKAEKVAKTSRPSKSNTSDTARKTRKAPKAKPRRTARRSKTDNSTAVPKPKRTSALDAAAIVFKDVGRPLNCKELIEMMAARELWQSPNGKTPEATLYAAILRTIAAKGNAARFKKVGRGLFAFNG